MKFPFLLVLVALALTGHRAAHCDEIRIASDHFSEVAAWPDLYRSRDVWMQSALRDKLDELGLARAAGRGELAVALVDITDPYEPRMAAVNAHQAMYAASLPKIAILFGAFHKASVGQMDLDPATRDVLTRMIRSSSNAAATQMLERVGFDYIADLLQSDSYKFYDPKRNGGLWVGKPYAKSGAWKRDPLHNLSHAATPFEVARFYYLLETGRLVSPADCATMKEMLSQPAIHHKFVRGLDKHRPGSQIYRKSGTWGTYHADSAIVERAGRRYIAVALAHNGSGGKWLADLIVGMDEIIHHPQNVLRDRHLMSSSVHRGGLPVPFGLAAIEPTFSIR